MRTALLSLSMLSVAAAASAQDRAMPVILDTDLGSDIDDTWALAMLLGCPELDLKLIVTASDDTPAKTRLVAKILERIGRTDLPLGTGVKDSDRELNQAKWLGDYTLDNYPGTLYEDGVQAMIDFIKAAPEPITLIVLGPQTNIKAALERDPSIAQKARVVTMAGSVHIGYNGKQGRDPEWNVKRNVEAAQAVFAAPWDITMAPLDICGTLKLTGERYLRVARSDTPRAKAVIENYDLWAHRQNFAEDSSSILFDTVAVYLACDDALCEMETVKLSIDEAGNTVPDENGRPVRCALGWKNRDAFEELLIDTITRPAPRP
ncbi:MAG: nucleoside hydrolase [Candidatus Hydrogenedentes bacterium]|nr:nucleoside hydrolase [Candidatus Hydrogenedentota bacterium]